MRLFNREPALEIDQRNAMVGALNKLGNTGTRSQAKYELITVQESPVPTAAEIDAVRKNDGDIILPSRAN